MGTVVSGLAQGDPLLVRARNFNKEGGGTKAKPRRHQTDRHRKPVHTKQSTIRARLQKGEEGGGQKRKQLVRSNQAPDTWGGDFIPRQDYCLAPPSLSGRGG